MDRSGDALFVVFLSNRVHPDGKGDVTPLRARVATIAASAITDVPPRARATSRCGPAATSAHPARCRLAPAGAGVERNRRAARQRIRRICRGKRVGLLTNHTGRARDGATTIDLLHAAKDVTLVRLFSPEHGIRGILDASVPSATDERPG